MANAVDAPPDNGKIGLPPTDAGMNKFAPAPPRVGDEDDTQPKKERKEKDADILARARKRFDRCVDLESDNRKKALTTLKMIDGKQWEDTDLAARKGRPTLTINKLKAYVNQVANSQRENRPAINISPDGGRGDKAVADMFKGVIRKIERDCNADIAYDTAFWNAAANGWGWFRVTTESVAPESFDQTIAIRRVRNPFTVYAGQHTEPDAADMKYCFVTEMVDRGDFKDDYPDADALDFTGLNTGDTYKNWIDDKKIRIAEYFEVKTKKRKLVSLSNGWIGWDDELDESVKTRIANGDIEVDNSRTADCPKIMWHKITAKQVLESKEWLGKWIPLVKVTGLEIDIEGKNSLSGVVSDALDSQRMYNFWSSAETETIAQAPKSPFMVAEGQLDGFKDDWDQLNTKSTNYLMYKPVDLEGRPAPPPQRTAPAPVPTGIVQAKQGVSQDMQAVTGIRFDATMHERTNDESGRALREIRRATDIATYHFVDNLTRSLKHTGVVLIDLIPKVFDTKRIATMIREDGTEEAVQMDPNQPKASMDINHPDKPGMKMKSFNPRMGQYGVTVTTGPSYATKRMEASDSMMKFVAAIPQAGAAVVDLIAKNQDWPESEQFATRLAKTLPPHLLTPDMKDVPPQVQAMLGSMQAQLQQLNQEKQMLVKQLTDTQADRMQRQDKIDKDFEGKILAIVQKAQATADKQVGDKLTGLAEQVKGFMEALNTHGEALGAAGMAGGMGAGMAGMAGGPQQTTPPQSAGNQG